ncbi:energy-dependent translational throttle protein EttA [Bradymonas sediminis]|uniref:Energy-dependent translational throttle protein EttA n=1 Tax=Bradymonas sediminis TaxID=1548548 RepID=A0A2Z4FLL0_9DELT|nr:energy-dependent translational throttle protein EttA [Bradymonas sediminis]AWV89574.1 energy-dependent translational throttle protein EttA [Bradymonas sediminis]TDP76692.1 ATP-binding cassette ChvD family protein [Bradymonas sediminis]
MAKEFIYQMTNLRKTAPDGKKILDGIWLSFFPGAKIGVVGPNGSGKSTLLKIMAGLDTEFNGETWMDPDARVGYLAQEPKLDPNLTVRENVEKGVAEIRDVLNRYEEVSAKFATVEPDEMDALIAEQAKLLEQIDAVNGWDLERTLDVAMDALRVPPGDSSVEHLSGGERRRVALCALLLSKPDLLLLDEPTNHLDAETVAWLERALRDYEGTVMVVTHDRYFLDNVTEWILELEGGKGLPFEGNYTSWLEQKLKSLEESDRQNTLRYQTLSQEYAWSRLSNDERLSRSQQRLTDYDALQQRSSKREHMIQIPPAPRIGDVVVRAENLKKGYGERMLIEDLTFDLPRGGIVGVVGPNGAGKSTLFKMISQLEQPDGGSLTVGETVQLASVDQMRGDLDMDRTVWENISGGETILRIGDRDINSRAYVGAFGFGGATQQQKISTLSGGERNRVYLAKTLLKGGNLLLLDEPSNDLDVETLRALEYALEDFGGCAVVISHDRWFLDRIATHILAFEGNSHVEWFAGNYQDYERDRRARLGEDAKQPHRIKYKPLTR